MSWVYKRSEHDLWTSGYYDPDGQFQSQADHGSPEEAAAYVAYLNGGRQLVWGALDGDTQRQLVSDVADELERRRSGRPTVPPPVDPVELAAWEANFLKRQALVAALRELADRIEINPDFPIPPSSCRINISADNVDKGGAAEVDQAAAAMGVEPTWISGARTHYSAELEIGPIEYSITAITSQRMTEHYAEQNYLEQHRDEIVARDDEPEADR